mgnify:CR=1 FL=1
MIVTAHPLAGQELAGAAIHYASEGGPHLRERFLAEFERCVALLRSHPSLGSPWHGQLRRLPLRRFPYSVVYAVSADELRILAVVHHRRRPGYWSGRT